MLKKNVFLVSLIIVLCLTMGSSMKVQAGKLKPTPLPTPTPIVEPYPEPTLPMMLEQEAFPTSTPPASDTPTAPEILLNTEPYVSRWYYSYIELIWQDCPTWAQTPPAFANMGLNVGGQITNYGVGITIVRNGVCYYTNSFWLRGWITILQGSAIMSGSNTQPISGLPYTKFIWWGPIWLPYLIKT